jgi:eukaryotic-like serine/threonine-protein kinase
VAPPASPTPRADGATVVTRFTPYSSAGELTVGISDRSIGECWTSSIVVPIPTAYRCLVDDDIVDPCFAPQPQTTPATVACVSTPWSTALVVSLTKPLPKPAVIGTAANPWAVELANGARCVAATGTVQSVKGVALNLLCPDGLAAGGLDNKRPTWTVKYGTASAGHLTSVAVVAAWRG